MPTKEKTYVVGIAGGSASGKSTLCAQLAERLSACACTVKAFHIDDYFKPEAERPRAKAPVIGKVYVDDNQPDTMDLPKLRLDLKQAVESGSYQVILVEGLLTLWDDTVYELLDLKLFVDCQADERIVRRLRRNMEWGLSFDEIASFYLDLARYRHDEYVEPSKWRADLIWNGSHPSQAALDMLTQHIRQAAECAAR